MGDSQIEKIEALSDAEALALWVDLIYKRDTALNLDADQRRHAIELIQTRCGLQRCLREFHKDTPDNPERKTDQEFNAFWADRNPAQRLRRRSDEAAIIARKR